MMEEGGCKVVLATVGNQRSTSDPITINADIHNACVYTCYILCILWTEVNAGWL